MAQDTQMIGQLSPEAETVAAQHRGWISGPLGDATGTENPAEVEMDPTASYFWDRRANRQLMGLNGEIDNVAGYDPGPSMAERQPEHFTPTVLPKGM